MMEAESRLADLLNMTASTMAPPHPRRPDRPRLLRAEAFRPARTHRPSAAPLNRRHYAQGPRRRGRWRSGERRG